MTRTTNARIAGFTFLFYIAVGITSAVLMGGASGGEGVEAKLASIAQHATNVRITVLLDILQCFSALVLAVTLYAITREQDPDLAMLGLTCRGADAPNAEATQALGAFLLKGNVALTATFFAVGSTLFSWLLLRGRMIPIPLAWLGVVASVLLVVGLPLTAAGFLRGPITGFMWIPMAAFEIPLALWLLIKGVAMPARMRSA